MKKIVIITIVFLVVATIVFTLFHNKATMEQKAKITPITSYPVSVVTVSNQIVDQELSQVGIIVSSNDVAVVSELQGKVKEVFVKEGSYVSAGSPLLKVDDVIPEANFLSAKSDYTKAKNDWERKQKLHVDGLISDADLEAAQQSYLASEARFVNAQRQYENSTITSPIAGIVTSRPVNIGTMLNPGTVVANVIDNSLFKVKLNVAEQNAFKLKVGDGAEVETDVYPGIKFYGKIDSISDKADEAHTYPIQIVIPNNKLHPLKSGMFGKVMINIKNQKAIAIPREALVGSIKDPQVYVVEDGTAKLRNILVDLAVGTIVTVKQGLREGEIVVVGGQNNLQDNVSVSIEKN